MRLFYLHEPVSEVRSLTSIMSDKNDEVLINVVIESSNSHSPCIDLRVKALSINSNLDGSFTIRGQIRESRRPVRYASIQEQCIKIVQSKTGNFARVVLMSKLEFDVQSDSMKDLRQKDIGYFELKA